MNKINKFLWGWYQLKWIVKRGMRKIWGYSFTSDKKVNGQVILDHDTTQKYIYDKIMEGRPFALCRPGFSEVGFVMQYINDIVLKKDNIKKKKMYSFFRNDEEIQRYVQMVTDDSGDADIMAWWTDCVMEDWFLKTYSPNARIINAAFIDPYFGDFPWTAALEGKRVLIVSPFTELIKEQYKKRELLFKNARVLPEMQLDTLQSVWYTGVGTNDAFESWFDALDYLYDEIMKRTFDVCILSCGPFGFDLATMIKRAGRIGIHMGGCLQIWFGIKGSRWEQWDEFNSLYNEHWVRPSKSEMPKRSEILDDNCYW